MLTLTITSPLLLLVKLVTCSCLLPHPSQSLHPLLTGPRLATSQALCFLSSISLAAALAARNLASRSDSEEDIGIVTRLESGGGGEVGKGLKPWSKAVIPLLPTPTAISYVQKKNSEQE